MDHSFTLASFVINGYKVFNGGGLGVVSNDDSRCGCGGDVFRTTSNVFSGDLDLGTTPRIVDDIIAAGGEPRTDLCGEPGRLGFFAASFGRFETSLFVFVGGGVVAFFVVDSPR